MKRVFIILGVFALALIGSGSDTFATTAFTIDNTTGFTLNNPPFTLGWEFQANSSFFVGSLGLFDDSQDGLAESHEVGLFDDGGNLLASTTVSTSDPLINQFRYDPLLAPIELFAGNNYFVGALYLSGADKLIGPLQAINFTTDPSLTFLESAFAPGSTLTAPIFSLSTDPAYFGPNFTLTTTAVPEPSTFLLLGAGIAGVGIARRRFKK